MRDEEPEAIDRGPAIISQYQAQGLTVALRMLERILFSLDQLYSDDGVAKEGIMVSLLNPMSQEQKAHLARMSARARQIIGLLAERFQLKYETADLAREAHGRLVEMWASLEDTRSEKLGRYGAVHPNLAAELDPELEELITIVLAMDREVFHWRPPSAQVHSSGDDTMTGRTQAGEVTGYEPK